MRKFAAHVKRVALDDIRLFFSPIVSVFNAIRADATKPAPAPLPDNTPLRARIAHVAREDVRLYFEPFHRVIAAIRRAVTHRKAQPDE
jgi:hypothetical protein